MADERWADIPGVSGYRVSSSGRIMSQKRGGKLMCPVKDRVGYLRVGLRFSGKQVGHAIHRLVAKAFLPLQPTPRHEINHKDGDKTNNCADNLEWVTRSQNIQHSYSVLGRIGIRGEAINTARLSAADIPVIFSRLSRGETQTDIAKSYGIDRSTVGCIARRITWRHVSP